MDGQAAHIALRLEQAIDRLEAVREALLQVHQQMHVGTAERAHEIVHGAILAMEKPLGAAFEVEYPVQPLAGQSAFDEEFRSICVRNRVRAAYIAAVPVSRLLPRKHRLLGGGDAELSKILDRAIAGRTIR